MQTLSVKSFSCIDAADLELGALTVLIGPQASGKSVLSKLTYFLNNLLVDQFLSLAGGQTLEQFKLLLKERFKRSFPPGAWGQKKFVLQYSAGDYGVRITRSVKKSSRADDITVWFSPFFIEQYRKNFTEFSLIDEKLGNDALVKLGAQMNAQGRMWALLGESFVGHQVFVPAGRSFFTNIGKAFLALEQGDLLDPIITRFGRHFADWMGHIDAYQRASSMRKISDALLGGHLKVENGKELLVMEDGREVPFTAMSSGQQELLPLVLALQVRSRPGLGRQLIYIEEPEAHLFPSAQSLLVEIFARILNASKWTTRLFLTTHSPYVLAKINNLIKAQSVAAARRGARAKDVEAILPKDTWIPAKNVRAYAIVERKLKPIADDEGLIDAAYLDDVSGEISREFSSLLGIEVGK